MIIRLQVFEQTLSIIDTRAIPRKGSKDYLILRFLFSPDWDGLDKLCYLQRGEVSQPIDVVDGLVEVPEWFTQQDSFDVTLFGKSGSQEVPTNVVSLRLEKSNTLWGQNAPEPQPSWLAKVIDLNNHPPIPGDNGYWLLWDTDKGAYVESELPLPAGGSGGTSDHSKLINRDNADQHPMSAVTGLVEALGGKQPTGDYLTQDNLQSATNAALEQAKASGEFDGQHGKSAYQYAKEGGYTGTEVEFAAKLAEEIPTSLPNPNALTFNGAVTGSYDGSAPMSVDIPSGGGSSDTWELINTITVGDDAPVSVTFSADSNGNAFALKKFYLIATAAPKNTYLTVRINNKQWQEQFATGNLSPSNVTANYPIRIILQIVDNGFYKFECTNTNSILYRRDGERCSNGGVQSHFDSVSSVSFVWGAKSPYAEGDVFTLYGVRT